MEIVIFVFAWFAGARLTRLVTDDELTRPIRDRVEEWAQARATRALQALGNAPSTVATGKPAPELARWRRRMGWRYERAALAKKFLSCPWCVGLWLHGGVTLVAWLADGAEPVVLAGPAWFTLPAYALGANWVYALVATWVDH